MRKVYILASLLIGGLSWQASAQDNLGQRVKANVQEAHGAPTLIDFKANGNQKLRASEAPQALRSYLGMQPGEELKLKKQETDKLGFVHQRYTQYYQNVPVEYADLTIHSKNDVVQAMSGEFKHVKGLDTKPALPERAALQKAISYVGAKTYAWQDKDQEAWIRKDRNNPKATFLPEGELVIVRNYLSSDKEKQGQQTLAWKFDVYALEPLSRAYVYVDAHSGDIVHTNAIIKHAAASGTASTRYSGTQTITTDSYNGSYRLRDASRGSGIETYDCNTITSYNTAVDFTDNDNNWTSAEFANTAKDNAALDAHWAAQKTYDYFKIKHNRNSYDGNGAKIKSYVHYDQNYENAFWNGSVMTYGDGATRFDALTSLDVGAHEIGHAVCSSTADLVYSNESGALNEGLSDIWAAAVEYYAAPNKSTWLIGEDIDKQRPSLRSMVDPNAESQPDTYKGSYWYTGTGDNGGVHTNSGVINHWFYILSVGKSGTNDLGTGFNVSGIGIEAAAKIVYRMESVYMSANSTYADARTFAIQAAEDLYGAGSNAVVQTTNAWNAVGVGGKYGEISYCASQGNNSSYEWIAGVKIGSFTKTSGAAGYSDFTGTTVTLAPGSSNAVQLTPGFASSTYSEYWKIWIDYNKDGDFNDAGELAFDAGSLSKSAVSGTMNIASSASGTTRMRVSMKYNGAQTVCESFGYGEVEDYTVSFSGATPTCNSPTGLTASNISATSATLSWSAVSGASSYNVRFRPTGTSTWTTGSVTGTSASATGLTAGTNYEYQVNTVCAGGSSAYSSSATFTTTAGSVTYCASKGSNSSYEWIDLVQFAGINKSSGNDGGYKDNTSLVGTVAPGSSQTIYISAGFASSAYTEYWKIWIDFNQDGDFEDSGELVVSGSSSSSGTLSATVSVPSTALLGTTRMRVSMKYNAAQTACETFSYGEVEDYSISVSNTITAIAAATKAGDSGKAEVLGHEQSVAALAYPNPAHDYLNIAAPAQDTQLRVTSVTGAEVMQLQLQKGINRVDVVRLPKGIYTIELFDGQKQLFQRFVKE
ncbi:M4 family metallopeptidase [Pontibacter mangrovi]|uniref:T9SS type A sorting domain-containing protein n=1 Tax=Pontibacter mangrovi TaxID=2589816 RepID=A0A501WG26_9BACT|nr:M4 family metallopeptidase [Pontibacter mangrovi]TPE45937.1 T9SS type A sorting domain-containing protein [Pontibacter mangrovi]